MKMLSRIMAFSAFIICLVCSYGNLYGQATQSSGGYQYEVEKNILIYRIRESHVFDELKGEVSPENSPGFLNLLPPPTFRLKLTFNTIDSLKYPLEGYELIQIKNWNYTYTNGEIDIETYTYDAKPDLQSRYYLIAHNKQTQHTIYICGDFYKSFVSLDFKIDVEKPKSLYEYLYFKTHCLQVVNIEYIGISNEYLKYIGYSELLNQKTSIMVEAKNPDNVIIN